MNRYIWVRLIRSVSGFHKSFDIILDSFDPNPVKPADNKMMQQRFYDFSKIFSSASQHGPRDGYAAKTSRFFRFYTL
jgi:hypothetical protein